MLATGRAKFEAPGHKPSAASTNSTGAVWQHSKQLGFRFSICSFQSEFAGLRFFKPGFGIIFIPALEGEFTIHGLWHEKAPALGGDIIRVFVLANRDVVDFSLFETRGFYVMQESDRVMLLSASTAEMRGVKAFFRVGWIKNLPLESDCPGTGNIEGRVKSASTRYKLMQFKRKQRLIFTIYRSAFFL